MMMAAATTVAVADLQARRLHVDHMIRLIQLVKQPTKTGTSRASGSRMIQLIHMDQLPPLLLLIPTLSYGGAPY
jgi:hypothetical protein